MISDNLLKYGLLLSIPQWSRIVSLFSFTSSQSTSLNPVDVVAFATKLAYSLSVPLLCISTWVASISLSFGIEIIVARNLVSNRTALILVWIVSTINIVIPCVWTYRSDTNPGLSMIYLMQSVVLWMKLISYNHVNRDLRKMRRSSQRALKASNNNNNSTISTSSPQSSSSSASLSSDHINHSIVDNGNESTSSSRGKLSIFQEVKDLQPPFLQYPTNLTIGNMLWFCVAPTLCYQLNYPRSPSIRWQYVLTILIRMVVSACFIVFCVEQYISPTLAQSFVALKSRDIPLIVVRLLKLAIPNTYVWLLGFYFYFHLWLNLLAELTRFGDRLFYKDWYVIYMCVNECISELMLLLFIMAVILILYDTMYCCCCCCCCC